MNPEGYQLITSQAVRADIPNQSLPSRPSPGARLVPLGTGPTRELQVEASRTAPGPFTREEPSSEYSRDTRADQPEGLAGRSSTIPTVAGSYLVTGGAGFIGSHLVDALLERGDHVVVLDTLATGRLANLDQAGRSRNFRFVQGSVLDRLVVDELMNECDTVVHMASPVGSKLIVKHPLDSFRTNIRGSQIVIEAAQRYRRRLLLASTSEIYGKNSAVPLSENSDRVLGPPRNPRWASSNANAVAEVLAYAYHIERDLEVTVVRLFNTVGSRQSPVYGMVVPQLLRQALAGKPLTVYGDGQQTRCFCHVADVVTGVLELLEHAQAQGEVFNLGSPEEISMLELAHRIVEMTRTNSPIELVPHERAYGMLFEDVPRRVPDISKIQALTGWRPARSLDDILTETLAEAAAEGVGVSLPLA